MHLQLLLNPSCKSGGGGRAEDGVEVVVVDAVEQSGLTTSCLHRNRFQMPSLPRDLLYDSIDAKRTGDNPSPKPWVTFHLMP